MRTLEKRVLILIPIGFIAIFNIFNAAFHEWSIEISREFLRARNKVSLDSDNKIKSHITYYNLTNDTCYHYEFRFEYTNNNTSNNPRLMILFNGSQRTCSDYWDFSVGRRILSMLRNSRFLILAICSKRKKFDRNGLVQENPDVKWIYHSLQKWMNEVYFQQFQRYPHLYVHGISRGSTIATLISRILPIQGQIITLFPGEWKSLVIPSDHSADLQTRLQLDPVFANWFYFDFCYNIKSNTTITNSEFCPFHNQRNNYQPVPPTYFIHSINDDIFNLSDYATLVSRVRKEAFNLGGMLLNDTDAVRFHILGPSTVSNTYMQEMFHPWRYKPTASSIFYQHFTYRDLYKPHNSSRQTCPCLDTDFVYFEQYPNITEKWSKDSQQQYEDYAKDVTTYQMAFCEEVCGDLQTAHAMSSQHLDKALDWTARTDSRRRSLYLSDYFTRPLRIWMYDKDSIVPKTKYFPTDAPSYVNMKKSYHTYTPEYYLQEYFRQLKESGTIPRHKLQWAQNPLLADYFIIPNDLTYYYFYHEANPMSNIEPEYLSQKLNLDYFDALLKNIRTNFPYWTMVRKADQMGSNHILTILSDSNMGILHKDIQYILRNVIQLVFTGVRDDMLNYYPDKKTVYRHRYDVVIPQYTRLQPKKSPLENLNTIVDRKTRLFFFAGSLDRALTSQSARALLRYIWTDLNRKNTNNMTIEGKKYEIMKIIQNVPEETKYIELIQSSVFTLSPEGFVPWTTRLYDAIQTGSIPLILADNIVLPFERFIDWSSFSMKINVNKIRNITDYISRIDNFDQYIKRKLNNALTYKNAFQWPYSAIGEGGQDKHIFLPVEDKYGSVENVFHYISLELRCRRLEQLYGLSSNSLSKKSIIAQEKACRAFSHVCPCHDAHEPVAFREFI